MARGSNQATGAATAAQGISNTAAANSQALFGTLAPELESELAHPAGFSPTTIAEMDTAAQQSAGGSNAGAVGQGALQAARTRNVGGADAAIASSARRAGETLSRGVLGTRIRNEELKQQERRSAQGGLEGLFSSNLGTSVGALGQVANNINANTNAENASWDWAKFILDPMMAASGQAASGGAFR